MSAPRISNIPTAAKPMPWWFVPIGAVLAPPLLVVVFFGAIVRVMVTILAETAWNLVAPSKKAEGSGKETP